MKNRIKKVLSVLLAAALFAGMSPTSEQKVKAVTEDNSAVQETTSKTKVSPKYKTVKLYVGMVYAPIITWDDEKEDGGAWHYGTVADLENSVFSSSNKKIASIDKKGIVTAKKAGSADIKVTSDEWSGTIKIKVLPIKKINKKKLVKTIEKAKSCPTFDLAYSYDKKDKEVKKGYVKANTKYTIKLKSVSIYKQPDNSKRYVLNYAVYNKKGTQIKNVKNVQVPYEQYLVLYRVCNDFDFSMSVIKSLCEHKTFEMHYEYAAPEKNILHNPPKKFDCDMLSWDYGWRNTCG